MNLYDVLRLAFINRLTVSITVASELIIEIFIITPDGKKIEDKYIHPGHDILNTKESDLVSFITNDCMSFLNKTIRY